MKKQTLIFITLAVLVAAFFGGRYWYQHKEATLSKESITALMRPYAHTLGNPNAKVNIVEFFDPACETCRDFYPFVKNIMKQNPDKIRLILRHAPFHTDSYYVVQMLEAAKYQNKYIETLEVLYKYQDKWTRNHKVNVALIWPLLPEAGLNIEKLQNDMKNPEVDARIKQDIADTKTLGVMQTPEFFVNGKGLKRFGYKELQTLIESEL